jgi:hydroxyacylglutathione hydrolase
MFHAFFDEGLAHSSYVIACDRTRTAAVVDPRRDVDVYVDFARRCGLHLTLAIETHVHADFVSGARELAAFGARTVTGPAAGLAFEHHAARHGETLQVGDITLTALHTPGHTPEHISVLVDHPRDIGRVLTGDTLFVGAVGRPDLLGDARAVELAGDLYVSIFQQLLTLPDDVEIHPAHGAGSLCGTGIRRERYSTIGQERHSNPMLQHRNKEAFVEAVLRDVPDTPPYFAELKRLNQLGPAVFDLGRRIPVTPPLSPPDAADAVRRGAVLVDLRQGEAFAAGHSAGAISLGFGAKVGYWAGWVVPISTPIVLMNDGDRGQMEEIRRQLLRVGFDRVAGYVEGGFAAWQSAGLPVGRFVQMNGRDLQAGGPRAFTLVDVRTQQEFENGHIEGALHVPVESVVARAGEIPRDRPVATICESGYRSVLAASLLAGAGVAPILHVAGGMTSYRAVKATA